MKRLKRVFLILFLLVLVSQIPFACRRYKLGRLNAAVQNVNATRKTSELDTRYKEYRGVLHVHSFLGGHSAGTFSDIIAAAQTNQLQFVLMTEHTEKDFDTAEMTLKGEHGGVLFVNGNEVALQNDDRVLVLPGRADPSTGKPYERRIENNQLVLVAYPEKFKGWDQVGYDGIEVYNVFTNASQFNPVVAFFDVLWSHRSYPDLLFASVYKRPTENLSRWDQALNDSTRLTAVAGNDAHANIGISLNDSSGKRLVGLQLDPYATSFRLVRLHVLIPSEFKLDQRSLLAAIRDGHCFIGFDVFGDTSGFRFGALSSAENRILGDEIKLTPDTRLQVSSPVASRIVVLKNGSRVSDDNGITYKELQVKEKGIYRVEVYLPQLGAPVGDQPWIISNPIYVR